MNIPFKFSSFITEWDKKKNLQSFQIKPNFLPGLFKLGYKLVVCMCVCMYMLYENVQLN